MNTDGKTQAERQWPRAGEESEARRNYADDWQRYEFAASRVVGARVLDCACGAGYGTALLAKARAVRVVGLDIAADALEWARREFSLPTTEFRQILGGDLPVADAEFDWVVSFETIEHVPEAEAPRFVGELARALRPEGRLILSTPITYGPSRLHPVNPFHLREYTPAELAVLLGTHFEILERLGQHSQASRRYADLTRTHGIGTLLRHGLHRLVPKRIRRIARDLIMAPPASPGTGWISAERWEEASVQIVVAKKK
jgi:2-polyprenyl-3-methyl-5-hydroxy-6-metoxy-1,4-benzoquinol methylase